MSDDVPKGDTRLHGMLEAALIVLMMAKDLDGTLEPSANAIMHQTCEEAIERVVAACPEIETILDNIEARFGAAPARPGEEGTSA